MLLFKIYYLLFLRIRCYYFFYLRLLFLIDQFLILIKLLAPSYVLKLYITEYYEEAMSLLCNLTARNISEDMWKVLELLYQVFEKEGFDYFTDMMPVLHNYITVDTNAFLSNENHILAIFNMIKAVSYVFVKYILGYLIQKKQSPD